MWGGWPPPKWNISVFHHSPTPPLKRGGCNVYQLKATWRPPGQSAFHQAFGGETRGDQLFKLFSGLTIGSIHYPQWGSEKCSNSFSNLENPVVPLNLLLLSRCLFGGLGAGVSTPAPDNVDVMKMTAPDSLPPSTSPEIPSSKRRERYQGVRRLQSTADACHTTSCLAPNA